MFNRQEMRDPQEIAVIQIGPRPREAPPDQREAPPDQQEAPPNQQEGDEWEVFRSTRDGRKMQALANVFPQRLAIACDGTFNVELCDDNRFRMDSKEVAVEFLNAIIDGVGPYPFTLNTFCVRSRKDLFENMVPEMNPIVFTVIQYLFVVFPFKGVCETLLLEVFDESQVAYYIDTIGRKYARLDEFEKHNKFFYGIMYSGGRFMKVNRLRFESQCVDVAACAAYFVILKILNIRRAVHSYDPLVAAVLAPLGMFLCMRNVQEFFDQRQFGGYNTRYDQFIQLAALMIHIVTFICVTVPMAYQTINYLNPYITTLLHIEEIFTPAWIYVQIGWFFESYWSRSLIALVH